MFPFLHFPPIGMALAAVAVVTLAWSAFRPDPLDHLTWFDRFLRVFIVVIILSVVVLAVQRRYFP